MTLSLSETGAVTEGEGKQKTNKPYERTNKNKATREKLGHMNRHTDKTKTSSVSQGTLSFGSLSERIDFDLSGVDFQEQIIEPLNLIGCLYGPKRKVITWWFRPEGPAPLRLLSLAQRLHKTRQISLEHHAVWVCLTLMCISEIDGNIQVTKYGTQALLRKVVLH